MGKVSDFWRKANGNHLLEIQAWISEKALELPLSKAIFIAVCPPAAINPWNWELSTVAVDESVFCILNQFECAFELDTMPTKWLISSGRGKLIEDKFFCLVCEGKNQRHAESSKKRWNRIPLTKKHKIKSYRLIKTNVIVMAHHPPHPLC